MAMTFRTFTLLAFVLTFGGIQAVANDALPDEKPLWPDGQLGREIYYADGEKSRAPEVSDTSPSGSNRVFSQISKPTYAIHRPEKPNGVALVI